MRASKNQWAVSPETIISHHFRLAKGIPSVVDATPPYSMFNSPISIHYVPKRASSADPFRRKALSKSQRELNDFVNGRNGNSLRLPLPIRSSLTDLVKPKLLENRNYQPPRRRPPPKPSAQNQDDGTNKERLSKINAFKNSVLTDLIDNEIYSDQLIMDAIKTHMEHLAGVVPWNDLEKAADELIEHLGIDQKAAKSRRSSKARGSHQLPFKIERIASPKSLESLSSSSSSSSKSYSSSSSSNSSGST